MATVTIRNLPEDTVARIQELAKKNGRSMEQELRDLIESRYAARSEVIARIETGWETMPRTTARQLRAWRDSGRP